MELTADNVEQILKYCLFNQGEDTTIHKIGEGVHLKAGFHPGRLEEKTPDIKSMCGQLPATFLEGWSFLNACMTKDEVQWGEHSDVDNLLVIGIASGCIELLSPRELWQAMPGGMPYFKVVP